MSVPVDGDAGSSGTSFAGVIFDLDGVVADTEHLWDASWGNYSRDHGVAWTDGDSLELQGLSVPEWSARLAEHVGRGPEDAQGAAQFCIDYILAAFDRGEGELMDGARELIELAAQHGPIGLATSSARPLIDHLLRSNGLDSLFSATVSSAEVAKGKPSPDVYLEAARRLGVTGRPAIGIEDSGNGIRAAHGAGLFVLAIPNRQFPPAAEALAMADIVAADHVAALRHLRQLLQ